MNTNDKAAPEGLIEEDLSAEEKVMHQEEAKRLAALKAANEHPAENLPHVHSDDL